MLGNIFFLEKEFQAPVPYQYQEMIEKTVQQQRVKKLSNLLFLIWWPVAPFANMD